ncbi:universal stress protein [Flavobacterium sp. BFFFF1]|uniref:universal stress protein n=1 Tax=Flavobacterium sp. BFFFF1 TaxID=2015557 RepID=UPI0025B9513A|nr:universal stress protein [Flavobacterium sp. BFFFF1]
MKKILFPFDFSMTSVNAFAYAIKLAKKVGAEIITVHAYNFPAGVTNEYYSNLLEMYDVTELGSFENYTNEVPKLREIAEQQKAQHVKLSHVLENGEAVDTILKLADKNQVDFIVMGTNGASGLEEGLFGSVTERVMNRSKCIVLAIPGSCNDLSLSKILFLSQYEQRHKKTLHDLTVFAKAFKAHIDVLQVKPHHSDDEPDTISEWKKEFSNEDIHFHIIGSDTIEETITDFMELHHSHLLAMTVKHKGLFERLFYYSIASKMVFHSKIPVLSIPYE